MANNSLAPVAPTALAPVNPERLTLAQVVEITGYTLPEIALIRSTVAQSAATLQDLALFLHGAKRLGLDPLARQIYWIVRDGKGGIQTGIDGYRLVAARTKEYAGSEAPIFRGVISVQDGDKTIDVPERATVVVWRIVQGHRCAFTGEARWSEFYPGYKQGFMWRKMPHGQLGKCAEAQALRKGFPAEMTGLPAAPEADDDAGHLAVTEVEDRPVRRYTVDESAAAYRRIHGSDDDGTAFADQPVVISSVLPTEQPTREPEATHSGSRGPTDESSDMVTSKKHAAWAAYSAALAQAEAAECWGLPDLQLPQSESVLRECTATLVEMVEQRRPEAAPA